MIYIGSCGRYASAFDIQSIVAWFLFIKHDHNVYK